MDSLKKNARFAEQLCLLIVITGSFVLLNVPGRLLVHGATFVVLFGEVAPLPWLLSVGAKPKPSVSTPSAVGHPS